MQPLLFSNSAQTTLAGAITNISTTAVLQSGAGALFPNPSTGQSFAATLIDAATGLIKEIVEVTSRAGDTVTIVRGRESTVATAYAAGDTFASLLTAGQVQSMTQGGNAISTYAGNPNGYVAGTSGTPGSTAPDMVWDSTHNVMWACETTGNAGAAVWASPPGRLLRTLVYTLSGGVQYVSVDGGTPTTVGAGAYAQGLGVNKIIARIMGGGGGGGGSGSSDAAGGGGGSGYAEVSVAVTSGSPITITVGAAGAAGTANSVGGNGGTSSLGSVASATGGVGGGNGGSQGGLGGHGIGGSVNAYGAPGFPGCTGMSAALLGGSGASTPFGGGGLETTGVGSAATGYGAGGSGAGGSTSVAGGVGAPGIIIVQELS